MREQKQFFVYIMTNHPRSAVLYTGITGNLPHRVWQHKNKLIPGFTSRYNLTRLVYYERFFYPDAAIAREKEIKDWRRSKKIKLIESMNPRWENLAKDWGNEFKPEPAAADRQEIPRPAGENAGLRDDAFSLIVRKSACPARADKERDDDAGDGVQNCITHADQQPSEKTDKPGRIVESQGHD